MNQSLRTARHVIKAAVSILEAENRLHKSLCRCSACSAGQLLSDALDDLEQERPAAWLDRHEARAFANQF